jgi:DAK2 domain fusion protein YloV
MKADLRPSDLPGSESLKRMFSVSSEWLTQNAGALNAINVFPVPDGDTGSNMSATLSAAAAAAEEADAGIASVLTAAATGALLGARGNSGVILSQILSGLAEGVGKGEFSALSLARGLRSADAAARRAVSEPREGTILSVMSDVASAAEAAAEDGRSLTETVSLAAVAGHESVLRTPELLPILREAGVVDSGGLGLALILDGFDSALTGSRLTADSLPQLDFASASLAGHPQAVDELGYCTEFVLEAEALPESDLRQAMLQMGTSVLVVGGAGLIRVHIHTEDPGAPLSYAVRHGALSRIKIDNLDHQRDAMIGKRNVSHLPVIAVVNGDGFESMVAGYGGMSLHGGQTRNPSAEELLRAIDAAPSEPVYLLANNRNVLATAQQAARLSKRDVRVIPTVSVPQGIAALLAFSPDRSGDENVASMTEAAVSVRTGEVTRAARDVAIGGVAAAKGQPIGIIDDAMVVASDTTESACLQVIDLLLNADRSNLATLYYGYGVDQARAEDCARQVRAHHPNLEVEVQYGGQPNYDYVLSIE